MTEAPGPVKSIVLPTGFAHHRGMKPIRLLLATGLALAACAIRYNDGSWQIVNPVSSKSGG